MFPHVAHLHGIRGLSLSGTKMHQHLNGEADALKGARPVRRGKAGK